MPRVSTHGQLRELRSELNALVSVAHHRTGRSHGWIHNELRRLCGGPPIAAATTDQLKARIEAVRELQGLTRAGASFGQMLQRVVQMLSSNGGNAISCRICGGTADQS